MKLAMPRVMRGVRRRLRRRVALLASVALAGGSLTLVAAVAPPAAQAAAASCSAAYSVTTDWGSGFTAAITVTDNGTSPITGWTLTYTYAGNQTLTNGWNGNWTQSAKTVTVTNESYNGSLAAGGTTSLGANFSYSGTNTAPASVTCTPAGGGGSPPPTPSITASASTLSVTQGSTGTFTLDLSAAPSANVTVSVGASGNTGLTASPTSLTFTPSNYATAQTVTVTANSSGTGTTTFTASATGYTSATITATENASTSGGGGAAPQLHVSGNKLVDQNGNQVVLHGVDRSGTEYECVQGNGIFDGPNDQASITAMKSWGPVNAVRVPLNEACWNAESYVDSAYAGTNYINAIKAYVSLLNSNGIVAILDLHWTDGLYTGNSSGCSSAEATCQKPMPDAAEAIPFWTSVANTFKGNDAVIFDLFNEPYASRATGSTTTGWQCWENGGTCSGISYQVAGMQQMVNAVRSTGANNVLMLGGEEYANDLTDWLQYEPTDPDHNLVASFHSYNFNTCSSQSCWTSEVAPVIAQVPVIAGEIGENDCAGSYIDSLTSWLESEDTSFLAWAWNADFACSSGPGLITDYTGTPTAYGAAYKAILQALP
jgi:endoglucanase